MATKPTHDELITALKAAIPQHGPTPNPEIVVERLKQLLYPPAPARRVRFVVAHRLGTKIESTQFDQGAELGTGELRRHGAHDHVVSFEPAEGAEVVNIGYVAARLTAGTVRAEALEMAEAT